MLKFILKKDPNKHIAEVIISTVVSSQHADTTSSQSVFILHCVSLVIFCCLLTHQMQIELKLVDVVRETAEGHKSYT